MAPGMASVAEEAKRGRGRPSIKGKGMMSPLMSQAETAPITPDCIPKTSTITPPTPACVATSERVRPRRLFGAEEKKPESVSLAVTPSKSKSTPKKSLRSTPKKSAGATPVRSTPKKAKAKDRGFEDTNSDRDLEIRKSPRLTRSAARSLSETPKRSRVGRSRKLLEPVQLKKVGSRKPTRRTGDESLLEGRVRRYVKKIVFEGVEYRVGDDVYVRRGMKEDDVNGKNAEQWSDSDAEVEDCVVCGRNGEDTMIECDECLGGFHLRCLNPPLEEVPDGDWMCSTCAALARGENVRLREFLFVFGIVAEAFEFLVTVVVPSYITLHRSFFCLITAF